MIGKLDGVKLDDYGKIKEIIECKNRVSKFGNYQHDIDQVLLYLYIVCTNEKNKTIVARLVQQLGDEIITDTYTYEDAEKRYWEIRKALIPKLNA
jgi:hypothetical protein